MMRRVILCGLAAAVLGGVAMTAMPGSGAAQLFNSSKKENTTPAPNTASGGSSGATAPLFNSGDSAKKSTAKPLYLDPSIGKNARAKAEPFKGLGSSIPGSNNGFTRKPGETGGMSAQDTAIRDAAMKRVANAEVKRAQVREGLEQAKAIAAAEQAARHAGLTVEQMAGKVAAEEAAKNKAPEGPMVYDKHRKDTKEPGKRLFNNATTP